jgi:glycerophosphoryl diester phosphodiesterase
MEANPARNAIHALARAIGGKNRGEVVRSVVIGLLIAATVILARQLKQLSRSPNPAEWNFYTAEANDRLYEGPGVVSPKPARVVAHAGGPFRGLHGTNSLEALNANYERGHRLFEMDFSWTSDEQLTAIHDWSQYSGPSRGWGRPPTLEEFASHPTPPTTPTTLFMVYRWLEKHPDAFVVTDAKKRSLEALAKIRMERPELVHQFIVQIYQLKDYELAASQGFRNIILTLYRCLGETPDETIIRFAGEHPLFAVTMPLARCRNSDLAQQLRRHNVPVYVHTVNEAKEVEEALARGAFGVYSDTLSPQDVEVATSIFRFSGGIR